MPEQSNDYRAVVFGSGSVGKTSLILRFVKGTFLESYVPTVEDTYRVMLKCEKNVCTLEITDTSGTYPFPAMQQLAISKGHAFILVYSVTVRQSVENLSHFYEQIKQHKKDMQDCPIMLVGNKCDEKDRTVSVEEGEELARHWGCGFIEASAKANVNVRELFKNLLSLEKRQKLSLGDDVSEGKKKKSENQSNKMRQCCSIC